MSGRNARASLKIQTMDSAINYTITHFDITPGVKSDVSALPKMIQELSNKEIFFIMVPV